MAPPSAKPGRPQVKRKEMGKRTIEVPQYAVQEVVPMEPTRTALLVIDMQNDFVHQGGSLVVPDAEQTIPSIVALLELARAHAIRVAYS
jgi:isochorismate hydrolase